MTTITNINAYQLFQRHDNDKAIISVEGTGQPSTNLIVEGEWISSSLAVTLSADRWSATVELPTGGPYTLSIDGAMVTPIFVGDIWVLGGQSNMEGCGDMVDMETPHPMVVSYNLAEKWEQAEEPLHWLMDSIDSCHISQDEPAHSEAIAEARRVRTKGAGCGLTFAKYMVEATGVPVALLPCAHGGTRMFEWDPDKLELGGGSLYGSMMRRIDVVGGKVAGMLWYQGCSDAMTPGDPPLFAQRLRDFVTAVRTHLNAPELPFYQVQIGKVFVEPNPELVVWWNQIQNDQRESEPEIPYQAMVSAIDLPNDDLIHIGTSAQKRLGLRLAKMALGEVTTIKLERAWQSAPSEVRVRFSGVNGRLVSPGQLSGFSLRTADGEPFHSLYSQSVDEANPMEVLLKVQDPLRDDLVLWYGWGLYPLCNLVDEQDMPVAVMGPIDIERLPQE